ncbi:MAG: cation transporter [Azoarcus sp.]|nr:cation transporter [Azoarcus sp.]
MKTSGQPDADILESLRRCIALAAIAHHIPGRIRLKLDVSAETLRRVGHPGIEVGRFGGALGAIPGIRRIQLNKLARSLTVEYDNQTIPDRAWPDLLANRPSPEAAALLDRLREGCLQPTDT